MNRDLSALPPNATREDYLKALRPYITDVGDLIKLFPKQQEDEWTPAGSGILNKRTGVTQSNPYATPTKQKRWSDPYQMNGVVVQKDLDSGEIRTAVTREPQFRVTQEAPVTPVTIQDPDNPRETIIIDGRTRKVLGRGPKMTEAGKIDAKADIAMGGLGADLQAAEDLLTGVVRTSDGQVVKGDLPTASGFGSLANKALGFVGVTGSGAPQAKELETVAARLVGRIPRFEGPQSDKDVQLYKAAAADVGNDSLPIPTRLAALRRMRSIYAGYESGERGRIIGTAGGRTSSEAINPTRRATDAPSGVDQKVWDVMTPEQRKLWGK